MRTVHCGWLQLLAARLAQGCCRRVSRRTLLPAREISRIWNYIVREIVKQTGGGNGTVGYVAELVKSLESNPDNELIVFWSKTNWPDRLLWWPAIRAVSAPTWRSVTTG